jgi:hypothetical protein
MINEPLGFSSRGSIVFLVETGEAWNPSHRNILSLLKQRRALVVKFNR